MPDLRVAVVSSILDRSHGTELCIIEQIERLTSQHGWEVRLYSQRVRDVKGLSLDATKDSDSRIFWHRVADLRHPGR